MSTYTAPEVRELGTVSAFTLGSTHHPTTAVTKANTSTPDYYSGTSTNPANYGVPCTVTAPIIGTESCNTP